jgi:hypothetical protein
MFHTIDQCYLRKSIVSERVRHNHNPMQVPFQRYGTWIIDESQIPVDKAVGSTPIFNTFQNPELSSFNNIFSSPEGRRGRLSEVAASQILSRMEAARNRASATMAIQCNEDEGTVAVAQWEHWRKSARHRQRYVTASSTRSREGHTEMCRRHGL